jgi:hypothetical protein
MQRESSSWALSLAAAVVSLILPLTAIGAQRCVLGEYFNSTT